MTAYDEPDFMKIKTTTASQKCSLEERDDISSGQAEGCRWFSQNLSAPSRTVFVFIHGVLSNNRECWTNPANSKSWPTLVANDHRLGCPDVYLAGYHSKLSSGKFDAKDAAITISHSLSNDKVLNYDRIVFVCHSQGGIVGRRLVLALVETLRTKRVGLFLCASPSWGSRLGSKIGPLCRLIGFSQGERLAFDDPTLMELDRDFQTLMDPGPFPETEWRPMGRNLLETKGLLVKKIRLPIMPVHPDSASRYYPWERVVDSTHSSIVKPDSIRHQSHVSLVNFCQIKLLVTAHLIPKSLKTLERDLKELIRCCARDSIASRELRLDCLTTLKNSAKETLEVVDRERQDFVNILNALAGSAECDPFEGETAVWPLMDVSEQNLSRLLNEIIPTILTDYV